MDKIKFFDIHGEPLKPGQWAIGWYQGASTYYGPCLLENDDDLNNMYFHCWGRLEIVNEDRPPYQGIATSLEAKDDQ